MPKYNERKSKPKRVDNPTAIYNKPKRLMHSVYHAPLPLLPAGEREDRTATAQRKTKPNVLSNPTLRLQRKQARTSSFFFTCDEKEGLNGCTRKAPQRVNAGIRHMHHEHSAYSNPTCALRAPFVWHASDLLFYLCEAMKVKIHGPTNAAVTTLAFYRNKQHEHNAYTCHDSKIYERRVVRLLCCVALKSF